MSQSQKVLVAGTGLSGISAAKLLLDGATYEQIVKAVEISTATISRINRCIQYGSGGYRETIEKVRGTQNPKKQE